APLGLDRYLVQWLSFAQQDGMCFQVILFRPWKNMAVTWALLGSVSDYCAKHVKCPVVIVKHTDDK
ncbi:hypothetical protein CFP56_035576, partial [Quercus suber]